MTPTLEDNLLSPQEETLPETIPKKSTEEKPRNNLTKIIGTSLAIILSSALAYAIITYSFPTKNNSQKTRIQYEEKREPNYWLNTELFGVKIKANWTELIYENKSEE